MLDFWGAWLFIVAWFGWLLFALSLVGFGYFTGSDVFGDLMCGVVTFVCCLWRGCFGFDLGWDVAICS